MARMVADALSKELGQQFIVDNVGGAGGTIGTLRAAKTTPDGYTLIQTGVGQNAVAHGLDPKLGYDSMRDFVHVAQVHSGPERAGGSSRARHSRPSRSWSTTCARTRAS